MDIQMQQRPFGSISNTDDIVEDVYLQSFQDLRESGKDAKEAFRIAKDLSLAAGLVVKSEIALCAIRLHLQNKNVDSSEVHLELPNGIDKKINMKRMMTTKNLIRLREMEKCLEMTVM
jgi:hypothetical protein